MRIVPYQDKLTIGNAGEEIFSRRVGLMYNAQFGPDMADVAERQETAVHFIDNE